MIGYFLSMFRTKDASIEETRITPRISFPTGNNWGTSGHSFPQGI